MNISECWCAFEKTGRIDIYLEYTRLKDKAGIEFGTNENLGIDYQNSQSK